MFTFMVVVVLVVIVAVLLVAAMRPAQGTTSTYELQRRAQHGRHDAKTALERESFLPDILSVQHIVEVWLLIISVLLLIGAFGWLLGIVLSIFLILFYGALARISWLQRRADELYTVVEPPLLRAIKKSPRLFKVLRTASVDTSSQQLGSRQELEHLVNESVDILTPEEKKLITHSLSFSDKEVRSIMTPKGMIDTVKKTEFLGPLVLSELHTLGHSRLPVVNVDIDHVVGVLHMNDLLSLDVRQSVTAEKAMDPKVFYIHEHDTLSHALAAFLRNRRHLFIVVNEFRETVGLLSLEDVMEALLGRKIIDEDDSHEDLRSVALRNPKDNNEPAHHTDV